MTITVEKLLEQIRAGLSPDMVVHNIAKKQQLPTYQSRKIWQSDRGVYDFMPLPDNKLFVLTYGTYGAKVLDLATGRMEWSENVGDARFIRHLSDDRFATVRPYEKSLYIYDTLNCGEGAHQYVSVGFGGAYSVNDVLMLADGRLLIASSVLDDSPYHRKGITVLNKDLSQPKVEQVLGDDKEEVALALLPDGRVVSLSRNLIGFAWVSYLKVWNLATGVCDLVLSQGFQGDLYSKLKVLPDGRLLVAFGSTIEVWNPSTRMCERRLGGEQSYDNRIVALAILSDGRLATSHNDKSIKIWDLRTGVCVRTLAIEESVAKALTVLPTGELVSGFENGKVCTWSVSPSLELNYIHIEPVLDALITRASQQGGIAIDTFDLRGLNLPAAGYEKLLALFQQDFRVNHLELADCGLTAKQCQTLQGLLQQAEEARRRPKEWQRQLNQLNEIWSISPSIDCLHRYHELAAQGYAAATEQLHAIEKARDANSCAVLLEYYQGLFDREPNNREYELKCAKFLFKLSKVSASLDESKLACTEAKMRYFTLFSKNPGNTKIKRGVDKVTAWERDLDNQARAEREQSLASQRKLHEEQSQAGLSRQLANLRASWGRGKPSELLKSYESLAREHSGDIGPLVEMGNYRLHLAPGQQDMELRILSLCKAKELFAQALQIDDYDEAAVAGYRQSNQLIEEAKTAAMRHAGPSLRK